MKPIALAIVMLFVVDARRGHVAIDVMFAYTPKVAARDAHALAHQALADANRANRASDVDVTFRVAGIVPVASAEGARTTQRVYDDLLAHRDFADAHVARAKAKADVLVLLVEAPGELGLAPVMPDAAHAVAVVDHRAALREMTVAHELGHILGARHDVDDDNRDFPFAYGHGFVGPHGRTIMAAPCARPRECPLVPRWSGPPDFGDAETANDARVLRETAATVAAFGDQL